jgi:hypothetical protein
MGAVARGRPKLRFQNISGLPQKCRTQACAMTCAVKRPHPALLATKGFFGKCQKWKPPQRDRQTRAFVFHPRAPRLARSGTGGIDRPCLRRLASARQRRSCAPAAAGALLRTATHGPDRAGRGSSRHVRFRANRTLSRLRRMTESDPKRSSQMDQLFDGSRNCFGRNAAHSNRESNAGHISCPHLVRLYSTFGGTCG